MRCEPIGTILVLNLVQHYLTTQGIIRLFTIQKEGEFDISFSSTGQCTITGLSMTMIGAYEILNDVWVIMYFKDSYQQSAFDLYDFYQSNLKR